MNTDTILYVAALIGMITGGQVIGNFLSYRLGIMPLDRLVDRNVWTIITGFGNFLVCITVLYYLVPA